MPACRKFGPGCGPVDIALAPDEFEALRLADFEGLYQEEAATRMAVSRQTFGRIIAAARKKVAQSLIESKTLGIGQPADCQRTMVCGGCGHSWDLAVDVALPPNCPNCDCQDLHADETFGCDLETRKRCGCRCELKKVGRPTVKTTKPVKQRKMQPSKANGEQ